MIRHDFHRLFHGFPMIPSSKKNRKTQRAKATVQDGGGEVSGILHLQNLHDDLTEGPAGPRVGILWLPSWVL
jgi:hypothetical protein